MYTSYQARVKHPSILHEERTEDLGELEKSTHELENAIIMIFFIATDVPTVTGSESILCPNPVSAVTVIVKEGHTSGGVASVSQVSPPQVEIVVELTVLPVVGSE